MSDSIELNVSPQTKAHYQGIAAGGKAAEGILELGTDAPFHARLQYFWLLVGTRLAQEVPGADGDLVAAYVRGAGLNQPSERQPALTLRIADVSSPPFGTTTTALEEVEIDAPVARAEVARILRVAADEIDEPQVRDGGAQEGVLRNSLGQNVGTYTLDLWN